MVDFTLFIFEYFDIFAITEVAAILTVMLGIEENELVAYCFICAWIYSSIIDFLKLLLQVVVRILLPDFSVNSLRD